MAELQKIIVQVPAEILAEAKRITGKGITGAIVDGLRELQRAQKRSATAGAAGQGSVCVGPRTDAASDPRRRYDVSNRAASRA